MSAYNTGRLIGYLLALILAELYIFKESKKKEKNPYVWMIVAIIQPLLVAIIYAISNYLIDKKKN